MKKDFRVVYDKSGLDLVCLFLGNLFFFTCLIIAMAMMIFSISIVECEVTGVSMQPSLNALSGDKHDIVYINKFDKDYEYGDIVVIETEGEPIIKRVMGLSGDLIDVVKKDGEYCLERNGEILKEDYILVDNSALIPTYAKNGMNAMADRWLTLKNERPELFNADGKLMVGEGEVFALGDNRRVSYDSSTYGNFSLDNVSGIVELIKPYGKGDFEFMLSYILQGKFFYTIVNML